MSKQIALTCVQRDLQLVGALPSGRLHNSQLMDQTKQMRIIDQSHLLLSE